MQDLRKWFDKAKIPAKIEKDPLNTIGLSINNQDIFQMTIDTRGKKTKKNTLESIMDTEKMILG